MGAGVVVHFVNVDIPHLRRDTELDVMVGIAEAADLILTVQVASDPLVEAAITENCPDAVIVLGWRTRVAVIIPGNDGSISVDRHDVKGDSRSQVDLAHSL